MATPEPELSPIDRALERIASGEPLRAACTGSGLSPWGLLRRVSDDPEVAQRYARAREGQAICDAESIDEAAAELEAGARSGAITSEQVQAWRASIDARKWAAARKHPKVYGDRIDLTVEHKNELVIVDYSKARVIDVTPSPVLLPSVAKPVTAKRKMGAALKKRGRDA